MRRRSEPLPFSDELAESILQDVKNWTFNPERPFESFPTVELVLRGRSAAWGKRACLSALKALKERGVITTRTWGEGIEIVVLRHAERVA